MTTNAPNNIEYIIQLTPIALTMLADVKDQRELKALSNRIDKLKSEPEKQGKPLGNKLQGYRSVRAVGQRYRIIYRVEQEEVIVFVLGVGRRKEGDRNDIYAVMERLLGEGIQ